MKKPRKLLILTVVEVYKRRAERPGFEPGVEFYALRRFSKPLVSATHPPLRVEIFLLGKDSIFGLILKIT